VLRQVEGVRGGSAGDRLTGDVLDNLLFGEGGDDVLRGAGGRDQLTGGAGADTFVFAAVADSTVALVGRDSILDFVSGTDKISLVLIDANSSAAGDQAFTLGALAAGQAGRLAITADGAGRWLVQGDVNGDGVADFAISLTSAAAPIGGDFLL
jgi:Ca2+-binding RTX toxin-like protein